MKRMSCLILLILLPSGPVAGAGGPPDALDLTPTEEKAVPLLAEKALKSHDLWKGKIYLTHMEVILDQQARPPQRYAMLIYYRYEGDLGIMVTVHLGKMAVTDVQTHPHLPVSLS